MNELLDEAFGIAGKKHRIKGIVYGTATNITDTFCTVEIEGEPPINKVKLHGIDDSFSSFFKIKPKDGSTVVVGIIEGDVSDACVLQCSEIDEVMVKIDTVEFSINANGVVMKKGTDSLKDGLRLMGESIQPIFVLYGNNPAFLKLQQSMAIFNNLLQ